MTHEYVFLLTKAPRYRFDAAAITEPAVGGATGAAATFKRPASKRAQTIPGQGYGTHRPDRAAVAYNETRNRRTVWTADPDLIPIPDTMPETTIPNLWTDARAIPLPDGSVQCVVTSPPYFGLRDYGTAPLVWGGDPACDHAWGALGPQHHPGQVEQTKWKDAEAAGKGQTAGSGRWCTHGCGAWQGHLGLEPTPELYVQHMVEVFREVRRVLRDDGTLWLNIGDSYARDAAKGQHKPGDLGKQAYVYDHGGGRASAAIRNLASEARGSSDGAVGRAGLKPKDLIGIPWMLAFALRADGWYLRQDIIWHKPNPMPESVRDRCTKAHEYLFLLTKSERYQFDSDAIKQPCAELTRPQSEKRRQQRMVRAVAKVGPGGQSSKGIDDGVVEASHMMKSGDMVNRRSVWTIATKPYKGAHFAVFPEALVEPCVLAGSQPGDLVFDPFAGSGTTMAVALRLGRRAAGTELNPAYHALIAERLSRVDSPDHGQRPDDPDPPQATPVEAEDMADDAAPSVAGRTDGERPSQETPQPAPAVTMATLAEVGVTPQPPTAGDDLGWLDAFL